MISNAALVSRTSTSQLWPSSFTQLGYRINTSSQELPTYRMHAVIRRSARSAHSFPASFIAGRRYPATRFFHRTPIVTDDARPPPAEPQDDSHEPPRGQNGQNARGLGRTEGSGSDTAASKEVVPESEEALQTKIQASRESLRRHSVALRKVRRQNDTLPPIQIPEWFLERNVKLADTEAPGTSPQLVEVFTNSETGEEIARSAIPLTGRGSSQSARRYIMDRPLMGPDGAFANDLGGDWKPVWHAIKEIRLDEILKSIDGARPPERPDEPTTPVSHDNDIDPRIYQEVLLSVEASLSSARPELSDSFPAAKANLTLHCPVDGGIESLDKLMDNIQADVKADIIRLDAQDIAQVLGDYLGAAPSAHSLRSLSYETHQIRGNPFEAEEEEVEEFEGEEEEEEGIKDAWKKDKPRKGLPGRVGVVLAAAANGRAINLGNLSSHFLGGKPVGSANGRSGSLGDFALPGRQPSRETAHWDDLKLKSALNALIDAIEVKRSRANKTQEVETKPHQTAPDTSDHDEKSAHLANADTRETAPEKRQILNIGTILPKIKLAIDASNQPESDQPASHGMPRRTIVVVKDYKELSLTKVGPQILDKLAEIIHSRRNEGAQIMVVGMTASADLIPDLSRSAVREIQAEDEESFSRTILIPPAPAMEHWPATGPRPDPPGSSKTSKTGENADPWILADHKRNQEINLRHIQDMIRQLDPTAGEITSPGQPIDFPYELPDSWLKSKVLPFHEIHRIALAVVGCHQRRIVSSDTLKPAHIILAMWYLRLSDETKFAWFAQEREKERGKEREEREPREKSKDPAEQATSDAAKESEARLEKARKSANKYEKRLLNGVVNPQNIKTTFSEVHAAADTVEALKSMTTLSLLRPEAFKYGVLATDKIPGLLLYGPPGTGKTLLAKAVAKESGATVLDVSGSEVYDMYVGEGEKNVRAIFTLARKLSPCVVFIDEADAIFGSRSGPGNRTSHREIINQFLKEWDGMNDLSVFIMVATNRPFDLDDAVLRRLPRRLLVDLPVEKDREQILRIHLKGEQLDEGVSIPDLAARTPFYSGSDLKNLCVAAALACVRDENDAAAKALAGASADAEKSVADLYPEKRTLLPKHFEKAMQEISASISEDMGSLKAIKTFDEQYGDRKTKRKRKGWGFAVSDDGPKESAARVRP